MTVRAFTDTSSNFHPYECDGPGKCPHCDRRRTEHHDPDNCALCDDTCEREPEWSCIVCSALIGPEDARTCAHCGSSFCAVHRGPGRSCPVCKEEPHA